jgi:hypothetical protein
MSLSTDTFSVYEFHLPFSFFVCAEHFDNPLFVSASSFHIPIEKHFPSV